MLCLISYAISYKAFKVMLAVHISHFKCLPAHLESQTLAQDTFTLVAKVDKITYTVN